MLLLKKSQSNDSSATTSNPLDGIDSNDSNDNTTTVEANNTHTDRSNADDEDVKFRLFANNSLLVFKMNSDDIGSYKCQVCLPNFQEIATIN